jgi:4-amino-4-deoxy-L-arabinose transferase-like glycosyltransferase
MHVEHSTPAPVRARGIIVRRPQWDVLALTLLGAFLRLWQIGGKGLWYDEAATALMARASAGEILLFHWRAAFEHPPVWALLMAGWSRLFGQSEMALRLLSAFAGILTIPLFWQLCAALWPGDRLLRRLAVGLVAISPVLTLYSQEARMYALATLLAVAAVLLWVRLLNGARWPIAVAFLVVAWAMLGLHYYSVLLLACLGIFWLALLIGRRRPPAAALLLLAGAAVPIVAWLSLAPGAQTTLAITISLTEQIKPDWRAFADQLWRELTFGSVVWRPAQGAAGYLLAPIFLGGLAAAVVRGCKRVRGSAAAGMPWAWLAAIIALAPALLSLPFGTRIGTRYLLFSAPFIFLVIGLALAAAWRWRPALGAAALALVVAVMAWGQIYYFSDYVKSGYRDVARYLSKWAGPADVVLLEAPRQHLLAKYYIPANLSVQPMPAVPLPDYWPVTAPPLVPQDVDDTLQALVATRARVWLVLAGQNEVDRGDFVRNYLTAIAFNEECREWLDVQLCAFIGPHALAPALSTPVRARFGGELTLDGAEVALSGQEFSRRRLFVTLHWTAIARPAADYKVTLRLLDRAGRTILQSDEFPIGPLLPPTTWGASDRKPGHVALELPQTPGPAEYRLAVGLYAPGAADLLPVSGAREIAPGLVGLARVAAGDAISVTAP